MSDRKIGETTDKNGVVCELFEPTDREVEIFCDGIQGMQVRGPNVKFNLYRTIPDFRDNKDEKHEKRVVAARIVMGVDTFLSVVDWLSENSKSIRDNVQLVQKNSDAKPN